MRVSKIGIIYFKKTIFHSLDLASSQNKLLVKEYALKPTPCRGQWYMIF